MLGDGGGRPAPEAKEAANEKKSLSKYNTVYFRVLYMSFHLHTFYILAYYDMKFDIF